MSIKSLVRVTKSEKMYFMLTSDTLSKIKFSAKQLEKLAPKVPLWSSWESAVSGQAYLCQSASAGRRPQGWCSNVCGRRWASAGPGALSRNHLDVPVVREKSRWFTKLATQGLICDMRKIVLYEPLWIGRFQNMFLNLLCFVKHKFLNKHTNTQLVNVFWEKNIFAFLHFCLGVYKVYSTTI